jgi:hypothetical protein
MVKVLLVVEVSPLLVAVRVSDPVWLLNQQFVNAATPETTVIVAGLPWSQWILLVLPARAT